MSASRFSKFFSDNKVSLLLGTAYTGSLAFLAKCELADPGCTKPEKIGFTVPGLGYFPPSFFQKPSFGDGEPTRIVSNNPEPKAQTLK